MIVPISRVKVAFGKRITLQIFGRTSEPETILVLLSLSLQDLTTGSAYVDPEQSFFMVEQDLGMRGASFVSFNFDVSQLLFFRPAVGSAAVWNHIPVAVHVDVAQASVEEGVMTVSGSFSGVYSLFNDAGQTCLLEFSNGSYTFASQLTEDILQRIPCAPRRSAVNSFFTLEEVLHNRVFFPVVPPLDMAPPSEEGQHPVPHNQGRADEEILDYNIQPGKAVMPADTVSLNRSHDHRQIHTERGPLSRTGIPDHRGEIGRRTSGTLRSPR